MKVHAENRETDKNYCLVISKISKRLKSVVVQNLPSERKLPMGKVQKKVKKTNNSAFLATHTYIKLTLVSFFFTFFFAPSP